MSGDRDRIVPTIDDDIGMSDFYDDRDTCWQCADEGFVADCPTDYECIDPESGCAFCLRACDICSAKVQS